MRLIGRYPCTALFLALLAAFEPVMITALVLPYPSTRLDWVIATGFLAPFAAYGVLLAVMLPARIAADVVAFVRNKGRN